MNKKQHKIGTTILLALAPACALGITTGVLASIKGADEGGIITQETFLDKYEAIWNTKTKSTARYTNRDITNGVVSGTLTVGDKKYKLSSLEYNTNPDAYGDCDGTFEDFSSVQDLCLKRSADRNALSQYFDMFTQMMGCTLVFECSSDWISYQAVQNDKIVSYTKYNKQGYVLEYSKADARLNGDPYSYQITYTQDPK